MKAALRQLLSSKPFQKRLVKFLVHPVTILAFVMGLAGLVVLSGRPVWAFPSSYPPYPAESEAPWPTLDATEVVNYGGPTEFVEGDVRITVSAPSRERSAVTQVWVDDALVFDTATAHPEDWFPFGARAFYTDLTGDGRKDILIYSSVGGNGLGAPLEVADLLIRRADGTFRNSSFMAFAAVPGDFADLDGDGRYEMLWVHFYFEGGHSYWVYRVVQVEDSGLRLNDALAEEFPKIIWFTNKPNDQPTQRLSQAERQRLIQQSTSWWTTEYQGD